MLQSQQGLKDLALVGYLVLGGEQQGGAVVLGEDIFHLPQDAGENVVADIGCDHRDGAVGHGLGEGQVPDVGTAALAALDEPLGGQQGQGLAHRLAADLKALTQGLLRGEEHGVPVGPVQNGLAQGLGHHLIFERHGHRLLSLSCSRAS